MASLKTVYVQIAGSSHHSGRNVIPLMYPGEPVRLERQPDNEYDRNAIAVYRGAAQLGFIPREVARTLAMVMDDGIEIKAVKSGRAWGAIALRYEGQPYE